MEEKYKRLLYISKSKKGIYDACPMSFKYSYIDKIKQEANPWFRIGTDVHNFIDDFFDIVTPIEGGELQNISKLKFHPNTPYKKNVAKFEIERWQKIHAAGKDKTFFDPVVKEKMWTTQSPKLIGVVDRVHKVCKVDFFAPDFPEFKDGDLVIVENKTGMTTKAKCKAYEEDMIWYKIIIEIVQPELAPIRWGAVYFPYDNHVHHCELKTEDCRKLAKGIKETREKIKQSLETGLWPATPSKKSCLWCGYKNRCPVAMK